MWNYEDIKIFLSVYEEGSMINCAKKLNLPSSTISRRLSKLEESLQIKLFERSPRKIMPTNIGESTYQHLAPAFRNVDNAIAELANSTENNSNKLRISAPTLLVNEILNQWVIEFLQLHEHIELDMLVDNKRSCMIENQIDVAIRIGPLEDSSFYAQKLWKSKSLICCSPNYLEKNSEIINPYDLKEHPFLSFRKSSKPLLLKDNITKEDYLITPKKITYISDIKSIANMIKMDLGIACLPELAVNNDIKNGSLISILDRYNVEPHREIYAVYHDKKYQPKVITLFINFIKDKFLHFQLN